MDEISPNRIYRFGNYTLDLQRGALLHRTDELHLRPRSFEVLTYLVRNAGRLISKQELFDAVWGNVAVTDDSLVQCLVEIRRVLGDEQEIVRTVRGKGYLFDGTVTAGLDAPAPPPPLPPAPAAVVESRRARIVVRAGLTLALVVVTGLAFLARKNSPSSPVTLAVLPLAQTVPTPSDPDLAVGLHEEVVAALGQIDASRLRVLSRRSTAGYRNSGKAAAEIGRELGVDYLVEGSIREEDARWRIAFTLVRVRDQVQVWRGVFDRDRSTLAHLQTELGRAVARQIRLQLSPEREQALLRREARHPRAHEHYLRGRALWAMTNRSALLAAIEEFHHATALDPGYALAYAGLADAYSALPITSDVPPLEVATKAREAAEQAVRSDGLLAEAHAALGWQEFWFGWNWTLAEASLRRATELDPNYANARRWLGHVLSNAGRHSEALAEMERARELDPFSPLLHVLSSQLAYHARDFVLAERLARQVVAMDRNLWAGHIALGQSLAAQDRNDEALAEFDEAVRLSGNAKAFTRRAYALARLGRGAEARDTLREIERKTSGTFFPPYEIAVVHAGLGEADGVFRALEEAYSVRDANLVFLPVDPKLEPFRGDPRYAALLERCGFRSRR